MKVHGESNSLGSALWWNRVRTVDDFPKPGVRFYDLLPVFADPEAFAALVSGLAQLIAPLNPDLLAAPEARAFLLVGAVADRLRTGVLPLRKRGKIPPPTFGEGYQLEYGEAALEAVAEPVPGRKVVVLDDVLATGGTVEAAARLAERLGAQVAGYAFALEIAGLGGRRRLRGGPVVSLRQV
jgi:adenine phosphoribosyltransferase